jgi:hypothetical protein
MLAAHWVLGKQLTHTHVCVHSHFLLPTDALTRNHVSPAVMSATAVAVWRAVAEDFAPFDVDVTTQQPPDGYNMRFVSHACIGGDGSWYGGPCEYV